ncbi:MAG: hypothetical protein K8T10_06910 [Candidatus Eremiobacteraeota bacterium]|nr:hypothetical protein [Candidatus Eremiobacteraeota bacterium]
MLTSHVKPGGVAVLYYPDPRPDSVLAIGDFNGWRYPGIPMNRINNGWQVEIPGIPVGELRYKFIVDGNWVSDPNNVIKNDDGNSIVYNRLGRGNVYHFNFWAPSIKKDRGYSIYLPPGYFHSDNHYSTIYLLHGLLDWEYTWVQRGFVHHTLDRLLREGKMGEVIVVMPRENGEFFKGEGMYADYIFRDLVGHIDMEFKTIAHPGHRAIDGLSTGGFASTVIGSSHPHIFSSIGGMSGSYDHRTFDSIKNHVDAIKRYNARFYISCGEGDPSCGISGDLAEMIRSLGFECEFYANPGPHDWEFWGPNVAGNIEFHWLSFQK